MNKKGFTLIELVMVIVIIGILAAVAIPRFISLRTEAAKAACESDVAAIRSALTSYFANFSMIGNGTCPGGGTATCNVTSGYPNADQVADGSFFAQNFFADGKLPNTNHIVNATKDWNTTYNAANGTINVTQLCTP